MEVGREFSFFLTEKNQVYVIIDGEATNREVGICNSEEKGVIIHGVGTPKR